jgi:hypothetical protein
MTEGMNVEITAMLTEARSEDSSKVWLFEVAEAVLLSLIAVATAWCGYQAAKWDGHQALLYGHSERMRQEAASATTEGGQLRLLDVVTFNTWIHLRAGKHLAEAGLYEKRFSPEYKIAFDAWLKTDPFNNAAAPAGPVQMPEYHNALLARAEQLNRGATEAFAEGTGARDIAELYIRRTVMLTTVLFLTAMAQRFRIHKVRVSLLLLAAALMTYQLINVAMHPRL